MKWTENGIEFEGTVEEYLALHGQTAVATTPARLPIVRKGTEVTVIDLGGEEHKFVRVKDAATYLAMVCQRNVSPQSLAKRKSNIIKVEDYMVGPGLPWNGNAHNDNNQETA